MSSRLEDELLVDACRPARRPLDPSLYGDVSWDRLLGRATALGVVPLLRRHLFGGNGPQGLTSAVKQQLDAYYYSTGVRNVALQDALVVVADALGREGIRPVVLKGAALAEPIYGDAALRPMGDLDLLVSRDEIGRAEQALLALGYAPDESYRPKEWYEAELHHAVPYVAAQGPAIIELHWQLLPPRLPAQIPTADVLSRTEEAEAHGHRFRVLAPDDLLLHVAVHLAGSDAFEAGLRGLCDLAMVIDRKGPDLDWDRFVRSARQYAAVPHAFHALDLTHKVLGVRVPEHVVEGLAPQARTWMLRERLIGRIASHRALRADHAGALLPDWFLRICIEELMRTPNRHWIPPIVRRTFHTVHPTSESSGLWNPVSWMRTFGGMLGRFATWIREKGR